MLLTCFVNLPEPMLDAKFVPQTTKAFLESSANPVTW
jgi:hypothetical protein